MFHSITPGRRAFGAAVIAAGVALSASVGIVDAKPGGPVNERACEVRDNNSYEKLLDCVTLDNVRDHQAAFQAIADGVGAGTRASGTPGYDASGEYVAALLADAGYDVTIQDFEFPFFQENGIAVLEQIAPVPTSYPYFDGAGFATMSYSGSGDATALTQAVDIIDPTGQPANTSTSGCEASDFAGFDAGKIAILQRGSCSFAQKALNAEAAGAVGVVIFNEGQPGRTVAFLGTLGGPGLGIPAVGAAYDVGLELAGAGVTARIAVDATSEIRETFNVIADSTTGNPDNVVMAGAHLDSVEEGPGIQDNGSGSAAILEVALKLAGHEPVNQLRFAWWGAEESGLLGSEHYVDQLSSEELDDIALYLNFDMIGSPNYFFGIYDGDDSDGVGAGPGPDGSAHIESVFEAYYTAVGEPFQGTDFSGRSDYGPFIEVGVPAGGLFTGAEGIKTPAEVALYGGTAGDQYDPCYHLACDTFDNVSLQALATNADAVAFAVLTYAYSTEAVNDVPGEPVPGKPVDLADRDLPNPTNDGSTGGGGLGLDHHHAVAS